MPEHNDFVTQYDWGILVDTPFGPVVRTNEELEAIDKEVASLPEMEWRDDEPTVTTVDLIGMCVDEDGVVDRGMVASLRSLHKQWKKERSLILAREQKINDYVYKQRGLTADDRKNRIAAMKMLFVDFYVEQVQKKIDRVERVLALVGRGNSNKDQQLKLQQAKQYPITSLLKFNRAGFACCVWHKEKTPSMKYYKKDNHVYCFGCNRGGDAIDVVQAMRGCDWKDAVTQLAP